jgi:hypothetical protein
VLTVYTSMAFDSGQNDANRQPGGAPAPGSSLGPQGGVGRSPSSPTSPTGAAGAAGGNARGAAGGNAGAAGGPGAVGGQSVVSNRDEAIGVGIRININTASRQVLRSLLTEGELPNEILEAILRYRNAEVEEEPTDPTAAGSGATGEGSLYYDESMETQEPKYQIFTTLDELDNVEEFKNWAAVEEKAKFLALLTTRSNVFTLHVASIYKRGEEREGVPQGKLFVIKRARTVWFRHEDGDGSIAPILPVTERHFLRVQGVDFPDEELERMRDRDLDYSTDDFAMAMEEERWNPFSIRFFLKEL